MEYTIGLIILAVVIVYAMAKVASNSDKKLREIMRKQYGDR